MSPKPACPSCDSWDPTLVRRVWGGSEPRPGSGPGARSVCPSSNAWSPGNPGPCPGCTPGSGRHAGARGRVQVPRASALHSEQPWPGWGGSGQAPRGRAHRAGRCSSSSGMKLSSVLRPPGCLRLSLFLWKMPAAAVAWRALTSVEAAPSQRHRTMLLGRGQSRPCESPGTAAEAGGPWRGQPAAVAVPHVPCPGTHCHTNSHAERQDPRRVQPLPQGTRLCPARAQPHARFLALLPRAVCDDVLYCKFFKN